MSVYRYERKYHISHYPPRFLEMQVLQHPAAFRVTYPPRYVNNIYLDSFDMQSLSDNIEGVQNRKKARIRWYGDLAGEILKPVLEFKIKKGLLGTKISYPLAPFEFRSGFPVKEIGSILSDSDLSAPVCSETKSLRATLTNRYYRRYYESADRKYRITIDSGMESYRVYNSCVNLANRTQQPDDIILEIKYDSDCAPGADFITNHFLFHMTRSSKYVTGALQL